MTNYEIFLYNRHKIGNWLKQQPNIISVSQQSDKIFCQFNHTPEQEKEFRQKLADELFDFSINTVKQSILHNISTFQTDLPLISITRNITLTNLSTSYVDVFPALYDGLPIPIHTIGYKKMGFVLMWNKAGGTSNHAVKLTKCDINGTINDPEHILIEGTNISSGRTTQFDFDIPSDFINFRGFVKLQAKSGNGTDDPQFDGLFVYLVRGN